MRAMSKFLCPTEPRIKLFLLIEPTMQLKQLSFESLIWFATQFKAPGNRKLQ